MTENSVTIDSCTSHEVCRKGCKTTAIIKVLEKQGSITHRAAVPLHTAFPMDNERQETRSPSLVVLEMGKHEQS
jgi:hypothetical protein